MTLYIARCKQGFFTKRECQRKCQCSWLRRK